MPNIERNRLDTTQAIAHVLNEDLAQSKDLYIMV